MNPMLKWIGGATGAVVLALGAATMAGGWMTDRESASTDAPSLEEAIPVDETAFAEIENAGETVPADAQDEAGAAVQDPAAEPAPATAAFNVKRILKIDGPIRYGDWYWDTDGVPEGPLVITVDLDARVISVFRDGYEIGAAAAMLGTDEHPTPLGTFPILRKQRHNVSEKYNNAPMPWSMFLTADGIAIHGGSQVENGYASHGCIAIPDELASRLFAIAKKGDKVVITRGATMQMGDAIL